MSDWRWVTTSPHHRARVGYGNPCAGITGWKLHAVDFEGALKTRHLGNDVSKQSALCGLVPAHGWGVDLFIDTECARCADRAEKLKLEIK